MNLFAACILPLLAYAVLNARCDRVNLVEHEQEEEEEDEEDEDEEFCYSTKPAEFCRDLSTAKRCQTLEDCKTIWKKELKSSGLVTSASAAAAEKSSSCKQCAKYVEKFRNGGMKENLTAEVIGEVLVNICEECSGSKLCAKTVAVYVTDNFKELLNVLSSDLKSSTICRVLDFCGSPRDDGRRSYATQTNGGLREVQCDNGTLYWCRNIRTAKLCNATDFCANLVWKFGKVKRDTGSVCELCQFLVRDSRRLVTRANASQAELRERFREICALMPFTSVAAECALLADNVLEEFRYLVASSSSSEMESTRVCSVAGFCNNERVDRLLRRYPVANVDTVLDYCVNCTVAWTMLERYVLTSSKVEIYRKLVGICNAYGGGGRTAKLCVQSISLNFGKLYSALLEIRPWSICHLSGMCPRSSEPTYKDLIKEKRAEAKLLQSEAPNQSCALCQQFFDNLRNWMTEKSLLYALKSYCITVTAAGDCVEEVQSNYKMIYAFVANELNSSNTCEIIGLCAAARSVGPAPKEAAAAAAAAAATRPIHELCPLCRYLVSSAQTTLSDRSDTGAGEMVRVKLREICNLASAQHAPYCETFVDNHLDTVVRLLRSKLGPSFVCSMLNVCPAAAAADDDDEKGVSVQKVKIKSCELCRSLTKTLGRESAASDVGEESFSAYCKMIPNTRIRNTCATFVTQNSAKMMDSMRNGNVTLAEVCEASKICASEVHYGNNGTRVTCLSCQLIVGAFKDYLQDPYNYNRVFNDFNEEIGSFVCALVGGNRSFCDNVLAEILPQIESVPLEIPNWFICSKLNYCPYLLPENKRLISFVRKVPSF